MAPSNTELNSLFNAVAQHEGLQHPLPATTLARHRSKLSSATAGASTQTLQEVSATVAALAQRYDVTGEQDLSDSLDASLGRLLMASQLDEGTLRPERLPDALQLLLSLASAPTPATLDYAASLVAQRDHPRVATPPLTWAELMKGAEGEGDPSRHPAPPPLRRRYSSSSSSNEDALTSSSSSEDGNDFPITPNMNHTRRAAFKGQHPLPQRPPPAPAPNFPSPGTLARDDLVKQQYWSGLRPLPPTSSAALLSFDPTSLAGALAEAAANEHDGYLGLGKSYWREVDVMREVLGTLQGRKDAGLFVRSETGMKVAHSAPSLLHLSTPAFHSVLSTFLPALNALGTLNSFVDRTLRRKSSALPRRWSPTVEAFAEALENILQDHRSWCVAQERTLLAPQENFVVSLLALSDDFGVRSSILHQLVEAVDLLVGLPSSTSPSVVTATLLDHLQYQLELASSIGQLELATTLQRVWTRSCEPLWNCLGRWIQHGVVPVDRPDNDFWIVRDERLRVEHADFLRDGFVEQGGVPRFMLGVMRDSVECGKAVHLLKTLKPGEEWLSEEGGGGGRWPTFQQLVAGKHERGDAQATDALEPAKPLSDAVIARQTLILPPIAAASDSASTKVEPATPSSQRFTTFSQTVEDSIAALCTPTFRVIHFKLHRVLADDCQVDWHLKAIQGLFLQRKGFELGAFSQTLFEKMDRGQTWTDYQLLNTTWQRAVGSNEWIDSNMVRFRAGPSRTASRGPSSRSVKGLASLQIDFSIPWPLVYIFRPQQMVIYTQIFTFLLQMRRAQHLINHLVNSSFIPAFQPPPQDLRRYYALRFTLAWVVGVLLEFFMSFVQQEIERFDEEADQATSVLEYVVAHERHVEKMRDRMLLNDKAAPIHRSIISLLDLCISAADAWTTLSSDTTFDSSRRSLFGTPHRRRFTKRQLAARRKRLARTKKTVETSEEDSSTDSDEGDDEQDVDDADEGDTTFGGPSSASFVSFADEGFSARVTRMTEEAAGLIGFVRRGVEGLARSTASKEVREVYALLGQRLQQ